MQLISTFFILTALVISGFSATVADVEADIATISSQVTSLNNAITAFPNTGGTLLEALTIHTDAVNLGSSIDKGTADVKATPTPIAEADGRTILNAVEGFEPTILNALSAIISKKAAFQALPIGGIPALVKQDLTNLDASTVAFENALVASAPSDLKSEAMTLTNNINAALNSAIAAYA